MKTRAKSPPAGISVAIIGLGAIGSETVAQVVRMPEVTRIILVDHGRYDASNLQFQVIEAEDVGRRKVDVQARRAARRRPGLVIETFVQRIEDVPLGKLRCDAILACLDSRRARQTVNQAAWRLGIPWVDAGVHAGADGAQLARVNVYLPGPDQPCLECAWGPEDYAIEQSYPCQEGAAEPAATGAPPGLGALAASMQVIEARKLLAGQVDRAAIGRQVLVDAAWNRHFVTSYRRNPACRFDHETWRIERNGMRESLALRFALGLGRRTRGDTGPAVLLQVEGETFVFRLTCPRCGHKRELLHLWQRLPKRRRLCRHCGGEMVAAGSDMIGALRAEDVPARMLALPLRRIGFRAGDVVTATAGGRVAHFEIGRDGVVTHKKRTAKFGWR
jgi:molybdopterin/thiamine biosynthesis adenylyltransferase